MKFLNTIHICIVALLLLTSCGEDRTHEYLEKTKENQWIYNTMKSVYLWNDGIKTLEHSQFFVPASRFFSSILVKEDKASFFTDTVSVGDYGMTFVLMRDPLALQPSRVYALVLHTESQSPAGIAGVKRGMWISAVNDKALTMSGTSVLENGDGGAFATEYIDFDDETGEYFWVNGDTLQIAPSAPYESDGISVTAVYTEGESKIGYMLCNGFDNDAFCERSNDVMEDFLNSDVTDIVIDLRYNTGGSIKNAQHLANMLVPSSLAGTPFAILKNSKEETDTVYKYGTPTFSVGDRRIFFITGTATKGTAELLVSSVNLSRDTYDVMTVGEESAGSNVMVSKIKSPYGFAINPATAVVYMPDGNILSLNGLKPDCKLDELQQRERIYPLGEKQEFIFSNIIHYILQGTFPEYGGSAAKRLFFAPRQKDFIR